VEEIFRFADAKKRSRMMDRWLRNNGEYHPEGLSMAYRDDHKYRSPSPSHRHRDSRSVYSQDMGLPWESPGTYSIRNSV
jgi:hypothetical protein